MIRLAVIGCGYWGTKLLRVFSNLPEVDISFICDQQPLKKQWVSEHYPQATFITDYSQLLDSNCDAVIVATPAISHYPITKAFLQAGKHVFVEKPLALSCTKAMKLVSLAEQFKVKLFVGHTFEFDPAIKMVKKIIQSGELGDIYYIDSIRNNLGLLRLDVNVLWDLVIHDLSILYKILGELPQRVSAIGSCHITQGHQNLCERCQINMVVPSNIKTSVQVSCLEPFKMRQLRIIGSQKSLVFEPTNINEIQVYDHRITMNTSESGTEIEYCRNGYHQVKYPNSEPLHIEAKTFIDSIQYGDPTNASIAIDIIRVLESLQTSLNGEGKWIDVGLHSAEKELIT